MKIRAKIAIRIKLELSFLVRMICFSILLMSNDILCNSLLSIEEDSFKMLQDSQKLCINFRDYPNLCKKLFNNCINDPHR